MKLDKTLRSITELIVRCCDPDEIILFGSYAKGNAQVDSDLDILVIANFKGRQKDLLHMEIKDLLDPYFIKIDLLLLTPNELALASRKPYSFLNTIRVHSVPLYQKARL
jgi:predicted nucleotidyltransferase